MTLILSLLTREFAMQASDRQLTDARTRRLVTEHANKAVVWGGAATLAFMGLAMIGSERADIWIAKHIREADDLPNGLMALCKAAKANGAIGGHALAVVGVGVVHNPNEKKDGAERIVPTVCWAANCLDEHGNPAPPRRNGWTCGGRCLTTDEPFLLHVAGQRLYQDEREQLEATIAKQLGDGEPPDTIAATLLGAVRAVAGDKGTVERRQRADTVGKGVQITCLPYAVIGPLVVGESEFGIWIPDDPPGLAGLEVGGHRQMLASEPRLDALTFMYVPPHVDQGIWRGPTWTWPRGMVLTDFTTRFGNPAPLGPPASADAISGWVTIAATAPRP
jgi:hypothetical protein